MALAHKGLAKLAEELGELGQVVGKKLAYMDGDHPDGGPDLNERMLEEMADVTAAMVMVADKFGLDRTRIQQRVEAKLALFIRWDHEDP